MMSCGWFRCDVIYIARSNLWDAKHNGTTTFMFDSRNHHHCGWKFLTMWAIQGVSLSIDEKYHTLGPEIDSAFESSIS